MNSASNVLNILEDLQKIQGNESSIISLKTEIQRKEEQELEREKAQTETSFNELANQAADEQQAQELTLEKTKTQKSFNKLANQAAIDQGKNLRSVFAYNTDDISKSKKEIINNALKIVCKELEAKAAAIFLISKNGILERAGIYGQDKNGNAIEDDWFAEESYRIDEKSLVGKTAMPTQDSSYGEIQYIDDFSKKVNKVLDFDSFKKYKEKFGEIQCAITIPLNGRSKTYGVLRAISTDTDSKLSCSIDNIDILLLPFATAIERAIFDFRKEVQTQILLDLSRLVIQSHVDPHNLDLEEVCKNIMDLLVQNPQTETAYRAGILRVMDDEGKLRVRGRSLAADVTSTRDDEPRKADDEGLLKLIYNTKKRQIVPDILSDNNINQFYNRQWIKENNFQSVASFPLLGKDEEILGTLTLYAGNTGYNHDFHVDSVKFLQGVADLLSAFIFKVKQEEQIRKVQNQLVPPFFDLDVESKFRTLAQKWKEETQYTFSINDKCMNPAYQQIIGLGRSVLPFLLKELEQNSDHWFWALKAIAGKDEDPVNIEDRGKIKEMRKAWLEWGRARKYV